jgi:hypothetical protein
MYLRYDDHEFVHRNSIFKYNQQDATLHNLFISVKRSTYLRQLLRPSFGAHHQEEEPSSARVAGSSKGLTKYPMLYIQF